MKKILISFLCLLSILLISCKQTKTEILFESMDINIAINERYEIQYELVNAEGYTVNFVLDLEFKNIKLSDNIIFAKSEGEALIDVFLENENESLYFGALNVKVTKDTIAPTITASSTEEITNVSWGGKDKALAFDLSATDNIDGDISDKIVVEEGFNNKKYGIQDITYSVTDSSGNKTTFTRKVNVVWDYSVKFIGHAGSYYGVENTEEAILYAAKVLQYQLIEVDLKQTKDGVFVLCHDDNFGDYIIADTTYDVLKDVEVTKSRNSGYPSQNGSVKNSPYTSKICTLERFLEICKEYGVIALIELKASKGITNSDQSRMQALMDEIERLEARSQVALLASAYNCLIWTRNNGYEDIPCQYLVGSCESEEIFNRCVQYNLDISFNTTYGDYSNSDEWIKRYKDAGLEISTYTYTQYSNYDVVQKWINKGVDYVTCDWHLMEKFNLPK